MRQGVSLSWEGVLKDDGGWQGPFVFFAHLAMLASMVFLQVGLVTVGGNVPGICCILPLVAPVAATTFLMGSAFGFLQGALAAALLLAHAKYMPGGITEYLCVTPLGAAGLVVAGLASGPLFALALKDNPRGKRRVAMLALACLGISALVTAFIVSGALLSGNEAPFTQLGESRWDARSLMGSPLAQLLGNALVLIFFILSADVLARVHLQPRETVSIRVLFRLRLLLVVALSLLIGSASAFVYLTQFCWNQADADMAEEADTLGSYLGSAIAKEGSVRDALPLLDAVVSAYDLETDGTIALLGPDGIVLTNNPAYEKDGNRLVAPAHELEGNGHISMTFVDEERDGDVRMGVVRVTKTDDLHIMLIRPFSRVFRDRTITMASVASTTAALLALVYLYAARLLSVLLADPIDRTNEVLARITANNLEEVDVRESSEFSSLTDGINAGVRAIRSFADERARRIERDLATAARIQQGALPRKDRTLPNTDALDIYANMCAARDVGGDFYDFFLVNDHTLGFLIADVSGKGIPAALFMMEAKNEISSRMQSAESLAKAMGEANATLCVGNDEAMFVTVWAATLDWDTGMLTYVNAGHNPPLLRHHGTWRPLPDYDGGPIMGIGATVRYQSHTVHLYAGDELLLYTDGVTEAMDPQRCQYGERRLLDFVQAHADLGPRELDAAIRKDVARWEDGADQWDDITMLLLELTR